MFKNKEGRQLKRFHVCILHTAASAAVPKLVVYIQTILCSEDYHIFV